MEMPSTPLPIWVRARIRTIKTERELRRLKSQHENDVRQLAALRDEVERVALVLLDPDPETARRAA